jgi:hypothetical protein
VREGESSGHRTKLVVGKAYDEHLPKFITCGMRQVSYP